ncbi:MAG: sugar-binding transcriptional regulator [Peptostreptococcaceae bacterium]
MKDLIKLQKKIIPQVVELMERRYSILRQISLSEPIGRRTLSNVLDISERIVRSETEFLKEQGLINVAGSGMTVTAEGQELLESLKDTMNDVMGLSRLQDRVKEKLGIKKVILVPGSYDKNESILNDIVKNGADYFLHALKPNDVVSITGGSTMLEFSKAVKSEKKYNNVTVVPARGSMGKIVETQTNNIVSILSKKLDAHYKLLNIPDELSEEAKKSITQEPEIKNTLEHIEKTDILVFGIGRADEMAKRRKLSDEKVSEILEKGAVCEAFGYYFNKDGEIVYKLNTIGIDLDIVSNVRERIAVFGGCAKVEACIAVSNVDKNIVLITDEESAYKILELN